MRGEETFRTLSGLLARPAKLFFGLPVGPAAVLPLIIHRAASAARFRVTARLFFGRSAALLSNPALLTLADGAELRRIGLVDTAAALAGAGGAARGIAVPVALPAILTLPAPALAALLARFLPALLTLPALLLSALLADLFTRTVLGSVVAIVLLILFHVVTPDGRQGLSKRRGIIRAVPRRNRLRPGNRTKLIEANKMEGPPTGTLTGRPRRHRIRSRRTNMTRSLYLALPALARRGRGHQAGGLEIPSCRMKGKSMSERGLEFAERWIAGNVRPSVYLPEDGDSPEADAVLRQMLEEAREEGLSREELEEDIGDLDEYVQSALAEATDAELDRMIEDDE